MADAKVDQVVQGAADLKISAPPAAGGQEVPKAPKSGKKENESAKILLKTAKVKRLDYST